VKMRPILTTSSTLRLEEKSRPTCAQASADGFAIRGYPFLTAEWAAAWRCPTTGGRSWRPTTIAAMIVTKLGSGANLYGYYMFSRRRESGRQADDS